jgi:P27 family predicted phage terminase small subunit
MRLSGSWRASTRKNEPTLAVKVPDAPEWVNAAATESWHELAQAIAPMRVLTEADSIALGQLAEYLSRWKQATAQISKYGDVIAIKDDDGKMIGLKRSPYVAMQLEYGLMIRRMMQEFGLTPSARARLTATNETKQVEAIFSRKASVIK